MLGTASRVCSAKGLFSLLSAAHEFAYAPLELSTASSLDRFEACRGASSAERLFRASVPHASCLGTVRALDSREAYPSSLFR
eukprot:gene28372-31506_t